MSPRATRSGRTIPALVAALYVGGAAGWCLHATLSPDPSSIVVLPTPFAHEDVLATNRDRAIGPVADVPETRLPEKPADPVVTNPSVGPDVISELSRRRLRVPIEGAHIETLKGGFDESRAAGRRAHEAVDILAPRHTPIHAVDNGTIAKLFLSKAGGTTIYQFDSAKRFCYYYAHLETYARGLQEGQSISAGDVLGYVGTSGNAPPNTPHLHFAVFELTQEKRWWEGRAIDPYLVFKQD